MTSSDGTFIGRQDDVLDPTGALAELARAFGRRPSSIDEALNAVAGVVQRRIPGGDEVSITLIDEAPATVASTGAVALELDEGQYRAGLGPCLQAARSGQVTRVDDVTEDDRYPDFVAAARAAGIHSSLSVPLPVEERLQGAVNIYSRQPRTFDEASTGIAESLARHVSLSMAQTLYYADVSRQARELETALRSRAVIEQAKGILMAARRCTADEAFEILVQASQATHRKLREVAADLVSTASSHTVRPDDGR